jgi:hypothetical protein
MFYICNELEKLNNIKIEKEEKRSHLSENHFTEKVSFSEKQIDLPFLLP